MAGKTKKTVTVVWNKHAEGRLVGVFEDKQIVKHIKDLVNKKGESHYIMFFNVEINKLNEHELTSHME
jgi:hypothetical protein